MLKVSSGSPATCLRCKYGCCGFGFIFGLCFISGFAGFLPVVLWVLMDNSLIINSIHFCRLVCICRLVRALVGARKRAGAEGQPKGLCAGSIAGCFMRFDG